MASGTSGKLTSPRGPLSGDPLHAPDRGMSATAAIHFGVAVEQFRVETGFRHADAVVVPRHGRPVQHDDDPVGGVRRPGGSARSRSIRDRCSRSTRSLRRRSRARAATAPPCSRWLRSSTNRCTPRLIGLAQQMPVERVVVAPFAPLAELAAHEQQLLSGMHTCTRRARAASRPSAIRRRASSASASLCRARLRHARTAGRSSRSTRTASRTSDVVVLPSAEDRILCRHR